MSKFIAKAECNPLMDYIHISSDAYRRCTPALNCSELTPCDRLQKYAKNSHSGDLLALKSNVAKRKADIHAGFLTSRPKRDISFWSFAEKYYIITDGCFFNPNWSSWTCPDNDYQQSCPGHCIPRRNIGPGSSTLPPNFMQSHLPENPG